MSYIRRQRALTDPIAFMDMEINENRNFIFKILGTRKNVYTVTFGNNNTTCSCGDFCIRKNICKHIYYVCEKIFSISYESLCLSDFDNLKQKVTNKLPHLSNILANSSDLNRYKHLLQKKDDNDNDNKTTYRNDSCLICLTDFDKNESLFTCKICLNAVHDNCFSKWKIYKKNGNCILCRSPSATTTNDSERKVDLFGNIVLY